MTTRSIIERPADDVIAIVGGRNITVGEFCADVVAVADALPPADHVVNICQDRYRFMVAFFAAVVAGKTTLLPGKRDAESARALAASHGGGEVIADETIAAAPGSHGSAPIPSARLDVTVAVVFTSGSTGEPQPHRKTWRMLADGRHVHWALVPEARRHAAQIVATVPPWHMYGLEWSMLMPTIAPLSVWCGPDFFPKDVVAAMDAHGAPSMLISTPLHLRALTTAAAPEEPVALVVCATAPLEAVLVEAIERRLRTQVLEIYGCSEVGSLAWRLPAQEAAWHFFDCFGVAFEAGSIAISHSELPEPVPLADMFAAADGGGWLLQGRSTDIVKVGGKRESLANLNTLLVSTDGVVDGVFYEPETFGLPATGRLGAIVVAPGLDAREVRARLASQLDPLFLPRPLHLVDALPRDTTSKLKQAALRTMIGQLHA